MRKIITPLLAITGFAAAGCAHTLHEQAAAAPKKCRFSAYFGPEVRRPHTVLQVIDLTQFPESRAPLSAEEVHALLGRIKPLSCAAGGDGALIRKKNLAATGYDEAVIIQFKPRKDG